MQIGACKDCSILVKMSILGIITSCQGTLLWGDNIRFSFSEYTSGYILMLTNTIALLSSYIELVTLVKPYIYPLFLLP